VERVLTGHFDDCGMRIDDSGLQTTAAMQCSQIVQKKPVKKKPPLE
jgi:hypothetical protein